MTPLSGKLGNLKIGMTSHRLKTWELTPEANMINSSALGSTADADGNVWATWITALCSARVSVRGLYDSANAPMAAAAFRLGLTVALTLGVAPGIELTCSAIVSRTPISVNIEGEAGFQAELQVNGAPTFPDEE